MADQNNKYQDTLNLPKTDFSMKAGLTQKEPEMLAAWAEKNIYGQLRALAKGKPRFLLHDGPPYANGPIHMGHALNKILKDLVVKSKTMSGHDCHYVPGWDCHGLPIEHALFKEMNKRKSEVDCVEFRKKAEQYALKYVGIQAEQFKRLGVFGDWDDPYLTLKPEYEYWILKSLLALREKGYIYRGVKPVNWCAKCETALAEAEVEYEDHTSPSVYVKFKVHNPQALGLPRDPKTALLIWTTTPWTLLANVAVAAHPDFDYIAAQTDGEILLLEENRCRELLTGPETVIIKKFKGRELTSLNYEHPFGMLNQGVVVTADYVTKEDGTGLVHTAPGHGQDDFETGRKYGLEVLMPVDDSGRYTAKAGVYAGEQVFKANPRIIEDLRGRGLLFAAKNITHSYPHCWRCKSPVIFRATRQWFMAIDHNGLRGKLQDAIKNEVQWIPEKGEERILGMVKLRPDWCLSRQRYWGVPIPALQCAGCGGDHKLFPEVIERLADIAKEKGTNAWFEMPVDAFVPQGFVCPDCGKNDFTKTQDILDVWFDSGVSHQAVIKGKLGETLPAEMYLEGSDQHRGWFQSSLIPAVAMEGHPPFKSVLTHGFVVDGEGRKMSKSLGNVVSPLDIIKNSGADILRLWVASSSYNEDIRVSTETLNRLSDAYRKIRNTFRYLLGNLSDFNPDQDAQAYDKLLPFDRWALGRVSRTIYAVKAYYAAYDFAGAYKTLYDFCNNDLSSFYLDILKDRMYTCSTRGAERRSGQTVLYEIVDHLTRLLAPILVFTADEIFKFLPRTAEMSRAASVHLLTWKNSPSVWDDPALEQEFAVLVDIRPQVLKALEEKRREGMIGSSLEAKVIFQTASDSDAAYFKQHAAFLPAVFIVSQVEVERVAAVASGLSEKHGQTTVEIRKAEGEKCPRCWNYRLDIGASAAYPDVCGRCAKVLRYTE
ncbi:MAG: isoleucine--tRNA ligase [Candidatus Omnitrophica bacterium]|nr:isoleucine--tRNA ligase [Candidatus Omnitrophota bacterium]